MVDTETTDIVYDLKEESPADFATYILPTLNVPVRLNLQNLTSVDIPRDGRIVIPLRPDLADDIESGRRSIRLSAWPGIPEPVTGRDRTVYEIMIVTNEPNEG